MIKRLDERSEGFFVFIWQFSADLKRSASCQQSIFFSHINEHTFFSVSDVSSLECVNLTYYLHYLGGISGISRLNHCHWE